MTSQQFLSLNPTKQHEAIEEAVKIGRYRDRSHVYTCYQIHGFYVETRKKANTNYIEYLRIFESTRHLEPYLKQLGPIDILLKGILPVIGCLYMGKLIKFFYRGMEQVYLVTGFEQFCV